MKDEFCTIEISKLRLWSKNPRYSDDYIISINDIGLRDLEIDKNNIIKKDNYSSNYKNYFEKLLNNIDSAKITFDLIQSLSNGYVNDLDDILVVKSKIIEQNVSVSNDNFKYLQDIFYVVEGNRRLLCINLLKNINNSRVILEKMINANHLPDDKQKKLFSSILKDILNICKEYDSKETPLSSIMVKKLNYDHYTTDEGVMNLNKILNSKHFGNRIGKLNWPRGLIFKKIFIFVKVFLQENNKEELNINKLRSKIEIYVGKKIKKNEMDSAIFVSECIEFWNKQNPHDKIDFGNTESGDIDQVSQYTHYDDNDVEITDAFKFINFSVSALENSKNNIKLLDKDFVLVTLAEVIKIEIDYDKIKSENNLCIKMKNINTGQDLSNKVVENIILEIVRSVKNKEINTRSFSDSYSKEVGKNIRKLIFSESEINFENMLDLSFSQIIDLKGSTSNVELTTIINNVDEIVRIQEMNFNLLNNVIDDNNIIDNVIKHIWKSEFSRTFMNKDKIKLGDIPIHIFSFLYRSTKEFLEDIIHIYAYIHYLKNDIYNNEKKDIYYLTTAFKSVFKKLEIFKYKNKKINDIEEEYKNEDKHENRKNMLLDLEKYCKYLIGVSVCDSNESNIKFNYFDSYKSNVNTDYTNRSRYSNSMKKIKLDPKTKKLFVTEAKETNLFGLLTNNNNNKINAIFSIIDKFNNGKTKDSDVPHKSIINGFIHNPLSSMNFDNVIDKTNLANEILLIINTIVAKINEIIK